MSDKKRIKLHKNAWKTWSLYLLAGLVLIVLFYQPGVLLSPDCAEGQILDDDGVCVDEWVSGDAFLYDQDGNLVMDIPAEFDEFTNPADPGAFNFGLDSEDIDPDSLNFPVEWDPNQQEFYNDCIAGDVPDMEGRCGDIAPIELARICSPSPEVPVFKTYTKEISLNVFNAVPDARKRATLAAGVTDLRRQARDDRQRTIDTLGCKGDPADTTCSLVDGTVGYGVSIQTSTPVPKSCSDPGEWREGNAKYFSNTFSSNTIDDASCENDLGILGTNWGLALPFTCPSDCDPHIDYSMSITHLPGAGCTGDASIWAYCGVSGGTTSGKVKIILTASFSNQCLRTG